VPRRSLIGLLTILALAGAVLGAADGPPRRLAYVVIVSRHGVRSPTWTADRLNQYSAEPWPDFQVPPGYLTPHGRRIMTRLGEYYGEWLRREGLLQPRCASADRVFVWADTDQRTMETARAVGETLLPGCAIAVHAEAEGQKDPLFDPIATGLAKPDPQRARQAAEAALRGGPSAVFDAHRDAFAALEAVLSGGAPVAQRVADGSPVPGIVANERGVEWNGPFSTGSTLSENLLLEYANGMDGHELGWGRLTRDRLQRALEIHAVYADVMRRTRDLAQARGSNLLAHVLRSMTQAATGHASAGALGRPGDALLFISGHDTNIANLSGMLDLSWRLPGYVADDTPPGGALVFSLWRDRAGAAFVRLAYLAPSLEQMRAASALADGDPPEREWLAVPGCATAPPAHECPWDRFARIAEGAIDPAFTSVPPRPPSR